MDMNEIDISQYSIWRDYVIGQIETERLRTMLRVNSDTLTHYYHIGAEILRKQKEQGWGAHVIDLLSADLVAKFGKDSGYGVRNLKYMRQFAEEYPDFPFVQVPLAQNGEIVQVSLAQIPWYHHISLISSVKDIKERAFYIQQTALQGWSRDVMLLQVDNDLYSKSGKALTNFKDVLPPATSDLARDIFKDPYNLGFVDMAKVKRELDLQDQIVRKISEFLLELGMGFAYVGKEYRVVADDEDSRIDLLMYHTKLHCYVAIELKVVEFKPEFVGKLNYYLSLIDDQLRTPEDNPTIGLLLCRTKNNTKVEYSLRGMTQPIGVSEFTAASIPDDWRNALPSPQELEAKLHE